jgi:WD40 repeat protein
VPPGRAARIFSDNREVIVRKVKSGLFVFITLMMISSACSPTVETQVNATSTLTKSVDLPAVSSTPVAATSTKELQATSTTSPTEFPLTPTSSPTPLSPSGTLTLSSQSGYGTGWPFSRKDIQLSADEQSLIVTTTAGVYIFSTEDLSPKLTIHEPIGYYPYYRNIRISRDGTQAITTSHSSTGELVLRIWNLSSGDLLNEYTVDQSQTDDFGIVFEIAISPDNQQAVLLNDKGMIMVISLADGSVVKKIVDYVNNTSAPLWLEFDPTGKYAYYVFRDVSSLGIQSVGLNSTSWQEASVHDTLITPYFPWTKGVFSPQLSSSGYKFGYFTGGKTVAAMDYSTLATRFEIRRTDPISAFAFSPDGSKVVMAGTEPTQLEVWKVDTIKAPEQTFRTPSKLWSVAVTSDGESSFGIDEDGTLYKWQNGQADPVVTKQGFWPMGTGVEFTEDSHTLRLFTDKTLTLNNRVFEFDPQNGNLIDIIPNPYVFKDMKDSYPQSIAISPDKSLMAVTYPVYINKDIRLFDYKTSKFIRKISSKTSLDNIDFTPDGKSLIGYGLPDGPVQVIDLKSGKVVKKFPVAAEFENGVSEMRLSGDKSTMILAGWDGYLKAYKTDTFELIQSMDKAASVISFAISNDGRRVAYLTEDGKLSLWDIVSNSMSPTYELKEKYDFLATGSFPQLAFSPDNQQLGLSTQDGIIRVFDIAP